MGTTIWTTDATAGKIIADELRPFNVRMFTITETAACVAFAVPLNFYHCPEALARLHDIYDIPADAGTIYTALIIKHSGLNRTGMRSVSVKMMDETTGPYLTGGANEQLLSILTPIKQTTQAGRWAAQWRAMAWEVATRKAA